MREHASLAEKISLFKQQRVHASDDELDDEDIETRQKSRSFFHPTVSGNRPAPALPSGTVTPRRISSAPTPHQSKPAEAQGAVVKGTPASHLRRKTRLDATLDGATESAPPSDDLVIPDSTKAAAVARGRLQRSDSTPLTATSAARKRLSGAAAASSKRRKRGTTSPARRPESDQVLQGLSFFYVPDNDIAPARRIRIAKAREYGAVWTRDISTATHVVSDRSIEFQDLQKLLDRRSDKSPPLMIVNEDYPIDCIQFKSLLDVKQKKYRVIGQPVDDPTPSVQEVAQPASSEESTRSLQLKPPQNNPRKWDYAPPAATPQRSEESSQASRVMGTPVPTESQPVVLDVAPLASSPRELQSADSPSYEGRRESIDEGAPAEKPANDELSQYVTLLQEYKDLPLDLDDEDDSRSTHDGSIGIAGSEGASSDAEITTRSSPRRPAPSTKSRNKDIRFEDRFACNQAGAQRASDDNLNAGTIEVLQRMANYYDRVNDHWRTTAYRKAISTLKRMNVKVTTEEEAVKLPMIGQRLAQKIEEIVNTYRLRRLEYAEAEPMSDSLQTFMQIYGVGAKQAHQWITQGYRTLDDLRQKAKLSTNQLIGVEHFDDLKERIPRREVRALGAVVKKAAAEIDPSVQLIIGGSYRRGAESSHDIDFIVTKAGTESTGELVPFLNELVQRLESDGFLVARLASSRSGDDGSKWHGCCILPRIKGLHDDSGYRPTWRRIDFLLVPESEMGAALIYFTGNDIFNRSMRLLASKKGMRLNQRGLYKDVLRGANGAKASEGELVEGREERRIFEILGVQWREPHERWC